VEEGSVVNGFGAFISQLVAGFRLGAGPHLAASGVPDRIIEHASREQQLEECGLDVPGIVASALLLAERARINPAQVTA
jgi:1-deoxy-D-xylulose-5-phosphate synthase